MKDIYIIPIYEKQMNTNHVNWLHQCLYSTKKTDVFFINDGSPEVDLLYSISKTYSNVYFHSLDVKKGVSFARNIGINYAYNLGYEIIHFLDYDDISLNYRTIDVNKIFNNFNIDVVYGNFNTIDYYGNIITPHQDILDIMHKPNLIGKKPIKILAENNFINLLSTTSVRTKLAYKYQFPINLKVSEDLYTFYNWAKYGNWEKVHKIISLYRVPNHGISNSRLRYKDFDLQKEQNDKLALNLLK